MTDSHVIFEGPGPFHLPTAQRATAAGHSNNGVTLTLYCLASKRVKGVEVSRGKEPEPISAQMPSSIARELAAALLQAADKADQKKR